MYRQFVHIATVAAMLAVNAPDADSADWRALTERAEAFLPANIRALTPEVEALRSVEYEWADNESSVQWTDAQGRLHRVELPSGRTSVRAASAHASQRERRLSARGDVQPVRASSADGRFQVYVRDHDLYVEDARGGSRRLTSDGEVWRSFDPRYARSNPTTRPKEPESPPYTSFIGQSSWLAAERWDFRKVGSVWLTDSLRRPRPELIEQRMAYPGDAAIPLPELWLFDAASGAQRLLDNTGWAYVGNMDVGEGGIVTDPTGKFLYFVRMSRGYESVELCRVEVPHGSIDVVWREQSTPYFIERNPQVLFVGDGRELLWKSERDGWIHYVLLDMHGRVIRQLTQGAFSVDRALAVDAVNRTLYFQAYGDGTGGDPYYKHGFRVSLDGGPAQRLDQEEASHKYQSSPSGKYFIDTYSTVSTAPTAVVRDRMGQVLATVARPRIDALTSVGWQPPERIKVLAADGVTDLYGVLWRPFDFDPHKHYPIIADTYPGPSTDEVPIEFTPAHADTALAQLGFIVVSIGSRGSTSVRGKAFQLYSRTSGNVRDYPLEDLRHSIESLATSRPWMDLRRVGVKGHSGGGFMAVAAMLHDPEFYRAGVASSGNHDNNMYEMNSSEFYWGDPRTGPLGGSSGYATNAEHADRLQGALLLVHGESDDDVNPAHTMRLVDALIRADKPFDLLVLPGQAHQYEEPARDYVRHRMWRYFIEHLMD